MNRTTFLLLLLVTTLIPSMLGVGEAKGAAVYPPWDKGHPTEGNPYTTIAAGLEAINPGDELQVMSGKYNHDVEAPYFEDLVIDKPCITLRPDPGVIIEGTVRVNAPGVMLHSLTIIHAR